MPKLKLILHQLIASCKSEIRYIKINSLRLIFSYLAEHELKHISNNVNISLILLPLHSLPLPNLIHMFLVEAQGREWTFSWWTHFTCPDVWECSNLAGNPPGHLGKDCDSPPLAFGIDHSETLEKFWAYFLSQFLEGIHLMFEIQVCLRALITGYHLQENFRVSLQKSCMPSKIE